MRKWGNWAGDVPVLVMGYQLRGKLTSDGSLGSYTCHIHNLDTQGNTTLLSNVAEVVDMADVNAVQALQGSIGCSAMNYMYDFDNSGCVDSKDLNLIKGHILSTGRHTCSYPLNP